MTTVKIIIFLLLVAGNYANKKKNEDVKKRCDTCRGLVKSFGEGMERTAHSSFAGGDTDWAEKKLGKYATSETRLIEVMEQLCEKDKYECHTMVEHNEELVETWWYKHQDESTDLFEWLCINSLQICCPDNRFGPHCEECPGGVERSCKGNGKCVGGGTKAGTGKCKCNGGYKGDLCDVCKNGFFTEMSNETHTSCTACDDSCASTCTHGGPTGCKKCKGGYSLEEEIGCQDINECNVEEPPCETTQFCKNTPGSYDCVSCHIACDRCLGEGPDNCIKCKDGFEMVESTCKDIDECDRDKPCVSDHMLCKNVPGSYLCDCEDGFLSTGDSCVGETILKGKDPNQVPDPSLSLKDGEVQPAEEMNIETEDTTTNRGVTDDEVGDVNSQILNDAGNVLSHPQDVESEFIGGKDDVKQQKEEL